MRISVVEKTVESLVVERSRLIADPRASHPAAGGRESYSAVCDVVVQLAVPVE